MSGRLSSEYLYHFKRSVDVLESILKHGFRHNLLRETLPSGASAQENFAICFCDIRWEESGAHRACYGDNAIVLTKEWGIQRGVSPVRYIHQQSPGAGPEYMETKEMFRFVRGASGDDPATLLRAYLIASVMVDAGVLRLQDIPAQFANDKVVQKAEEQLEEEVDGFLRRIGPSDATLAIRYLNSLFRRIGTLHNELELRDSFTRHYSEDFRCPATQEVEATRVLYDEREWRSIRYGVDPTGGSGVEEAVRSRAVGYLPEAWNLTFSDTDVVAVIAKDQATSTRIRSAVRSGNTKLTPAFDRIYTVDGYHE